MSEVASTGSDRFTRLERRAAPSVVKVEWLLAVVLIVLCAGCDRGADERRVDDAHRLERIHSELGLEPPTHLIGVHFLDDGGSAVVQVVDARGESLLIVADNRLHFETVDTAGHSVPPPPRFTYLHQYPTDPRALRLEFQSRAESAVVDLLRLQLRSLLTARQESTLVRGERRALGAKNPAYAISVWHASLTPPERNVLGLRTVLAGMVARRRAWGALESGLTPDAPGESRGTPP